MEDACGFCSSLLEGLRNLEQSLAEGCVSLRWSAEAMNLLKKMQVELLAILKKNNLPIFYGTEEDWFDQYMKETSALLDFCNSLKPAISGINRYRMVVDVAVQGLRHADPSSSVAVNKKELERVDREKDSFLDVTVMEATVSLGDAIRMGGNKHSKSISIVMLAAKSTIAAVSLLLVSAITSPISVEMESEGVDQEFPQLKPFAMGLAALVRRFKETVSKPEEASGLVLFEHEMVDRLVGDLKAQVGQGVMGDRERFLSSVELLRAKSVGLKEGLEMFDAAVDQVFDAVIRGRNEMLGILKNGSLSTG